MKCLNCFGHFEDEPPQRYKASVSAWVTKAVSPDERTIRAEAAQRIDNWLNHNCTDVQLDLSSLALTDLPPLPGALSSLNVSHTSISSLPENLPDTLTILDVGHTLISSLPENLPDTLTVLDVSHTSISSLPENLPPMLDLLNVSHTSISSLPENLPDTLTFLDVSHTPISSLPENLPDTLTILEVNHTSISSLPENLPNTLTILDVSHTPISSLPEHLPDTLIMVSISHTRIAEIPESLGHVVWRSERPCVVTAEGVPAWTRFLVNHSPVGAQNQHRVGRTSNTLDQAVQAWYDAPDAARQSAWERIHQVAQGAIVTDVPFWTLLDSLKHSAEYPAEADDTPETREIRTAFRQRVTHLLDAVRENGELRRKCFEIAEEAVETCHDRISWGFEKMELEHLKMRAAQGEFSQQDLARLGVGNFKLAVLDELAAAKARESENADEALEVAMAYRTRLTIQLDLPTKTNAMLYYAMARITDADLAAARETVMRAEMEPDRITDFLADWEPWQKDLERRYPEKFSVAAGEKEKKVLREKLEALEDTYDNYVKDEGEDSPGALTAQAEMNALMKKYNTLEQDLFGETRKQLTKEFVVAQFPGSNGAT